MVLEFSRQTSSDDPLFVAVVYIGGRERLVSGYWFGSCDDKCVLIRSSIKTYIAIYRETII